MVLHLRSSELRAGTRAVGTVTSDTLVPNPDSTAQSLFSLETRNSLQLNRLALQSGKAFQLHMASTDALLFE